MDTCADACRSLGAWAELVALLVIGVRWGWAEIARRRAQESQRALAAQSQALSQEVRQLSMRPPSLGSLGAVELRIQAAPVELAQSSNEPAIPPATQNRPDEAV